MVTSTIHFKDKNNQFRWIFPEKCKPDTVKQDKSYLLLEDDSHMPQKKNYVSYQLPI